MKLNQRKGDNTDCRKSRRRKWTLCIEYNANSSDYDNCTAVDKNEI